MIGDDSGCDSLSNPPLSDGEYHPADSCDYPIQGDPSNRLRGGKILRSMGKKLRSNRKQPKRSKSMKNAYDRNEGIQNDHLRVLKSTGGVSVSPEQLQYRKRINSRLKTSLVKERDYLYVENLHNSSQDRPSTVNGMVISRNYEATQVRAHWWGNNWKDTIFNSFGLNEQKHPARFLVPKKWPKQIPDTADLSDCYSSPTLTDNDPVTKSGTNNLNTVANSNLPSRAQNQESSSKKLKTVLMSNSDTMSSLTRRYDEYDGDNEPEAVSAGNSKKDPKVSREEVKAKEETASTFGLSERKFEDRVRAHLDEGGETGLVSSDEFTRNFRIAHALSCLNEDYFGEQRKKIAQYNLAIRSKRNSTMTREMGERFAKICIYSHD